VFRVVEWNVSHIPHISGNFYWIRFRFLAQMPAFLAEAHADAEAQAQVQEAQV